MAKLTAVEVFEHYYQALVSALPMKHEGFVINLQQHNLLPADTISFLASLNTSREKASYFLDHIVKPELDTHTCFDALLEIMIESGYDDIKELGAKMKSEIPGIGRQGTQLHITCGSWYGIQCEYVADSNSLSANYTN